MPDPDVLELGDLSRPSFSPEARAALEAGASLADGIELTLDALCQAASAEVGLEDLGDDRFRAPLEALFAALRDEGDLAPMGRVSVHTRLTQYLRNRLLLTDLLARHPEIHDVELDPPIIIAGLPRTGTTHLHNLLAADDRLRHLPYWEAVEPFPRPGESATADERDPRVARTREALDFLDLAMPCFNAMHELTAWYAHEEIDLLAVSGSSMLFDTMAPMPSWRAWYRAHHQTPHYDELVTILRALTFLRGGTRWVLKSPQHLEQFAVLRDVFPDAAVVVTHRDPVRVTASMATMVAYAARLTHDPVPVRRIGRYWADLLDELLGACVAERALLDPRAVDVRFDELMADEEGTLDRIYELAGLERTEEARAAQRRYRDEHGRNRHGAVPHDLTALGLDEHELRERFAPYATRFGV